MVVGDGHASGSQSKTTGGIEAVFSPAAQNLSLEFRAQIEQLGTGLLAECFHGALTADVA